MFKLVIFFAIINLLAVVSYTTKTILTIKGGKFIASLANGINAAIYLFVIISATWELSLVWKIIATIVSNFTGVYIVRTIEDKLRKDRLWKIEATIPVAYFSDAKSLIKEANLPHNCISIPNYVIFNVYCHTQNDSIKAKKILDKTHAKYFVSETKIL